jgi:hypothetical protein
MLIWRDLELDKERMGPDLLHIIPVLDYTMLDRVRDLENTSLLLSLITQVLFFAVKTFDNVEVLRSSDDRWKDASGGIFSLETCLDNA